MMILLSFSFPKNMSKIFNIELKKDPNVFSCIHGLRLISISWVILGHQYIYSAIVASNLSGGIELSQGFFMQIISNGDKVVDTFFTISGLLVSYSFFRHSFTKKKFPYLQYYLFRIIRLSPPVLMFVIFLATIGGLFPYGPLAPQYKDVKTEACRAFWWVDWTFFSNFVFRFGDKMMANKGESFAVSLYSLTLSFSVSKFYYYYYYYY
ncbi:Nose resistant to fluoxetine protein 6, partial [Armadillidium nasatum]